MTDLFSDREFVVSGDDDFPYIEALVDISPDTVEPLADVLSLAISRFAIRELTTEDVLQLRRVHGLHDQLQEAAREHAGARLRLTFALSQLLTEAVCSYVGERDVESYQSPEERARIAALRQMTGALVDLTADCHAAADELQTRLDRGQPLFALRR